MIVYRKLPSVRSTRLPPRVEPAGRQAAEADVADRLSPVEAD